MLVHRRFARVLPDATYLLRGKRFLALSGFGIRPVKVFFTFEPFCLRQLRCLVPCSFCCFLDRIFRMQSSRICGGGIGERSIPTVLGLRRTAFCVGSLPGKVIIQRVTQRMVAVNSSRGVIPANVLNIDAELVADTVSTGHERTSSFTTRTVLSGQFQGKSHPVGDRL